MRFPFAGLCNFWSTFLLLDEKEEVFRVIKVLVR